MHWNVGSDYFFMGQNVCCLAIDWARLFSPLWNVSVGTRPTVNFHMDSLKHPSLCIQTISASVHLYTVKLDRMGSFFLMYTVYKCTIVYISMVPCNNLYQKWSIKRIFFVILPGHISVLLHPRLEESCRRWWTIFYLHLQNRPRPVSFTVTFTSVVSF